MVTNDTTTYARLTGTDAQFNSVRRKLTDGLANALTERFSNAREGGILALGPRRRLNCMVNKIVCE